MIDEVLRAFPAQHTEVLSANHVLLTRFNLPSAGVESSVRARDGWLEQRVELFRRYCLPSVLAQSCKEFDWIVYLDPQSPRWLVEMMTELADAGILNPLFREAVDHETLLADIKDVTRRVRSTLITTNLDNDDALAVDFVERLQAFGACEESTAVYFEHGLIKCGDRVFLRQDKHNAFCSVIEPSVDSVTCWSDWHNRLHLSMPTAGLVGAPAWLQVVHGGNVSNRVHGALVSPAPYDALFPRLLDDVTPPSRRQVVRDRCVTSPMRIVRDGIRQAVKALALAIFGKDGLTKVKSVVARTK